MVDSFNMEKVSYAIEDFKPSGKIPLKLFIFTVGHLTINDLSIFYPDLPKGSRSNYSNFCYLIQHPKGYLMWDTGLADSVCSLENGITVLNGNLHWTLKKTLKSQLEEMNIVPEQVDYLSFSHMHADHTGNSGYFKKATFFVQEKEYLFAFSEEAVNYGYVPDSYTQLENQPIKKINGFYDVFGDGSVVMIPAFGHTPGHQILLVDLPKYGPIILGGDLYFSEKDHRNKINQIFTIDQKKIRYSFSSVENLIKKTNAQLWLNHDIEFNKKIYNSKEYYD